MSVAAVAGALVAAAGANPAMAGAVATTSAVQVQAGRPCGASFSHFGTATTVWYRHCTSGNDRVRVRAIIHWGFNGPCETVYADQTKAIHNFIAPARFDRIQSC